MGAAKGRCVRVGVRARGHLELEEHQRRLRADQLLRLETGAGEIRRRGLRGAERKGGADGGTRTARDRRPQIDPRHGDRAEPPRPPEVARNLPRGDLRMSATANPIEGGQTAVPAPSRRPRRGLSKRSGERASNAASVAVIAFIMLLLFGPLVLLAIFSFNSSTIISLPFEAFTTHWYKAALEDPGARSSIEHSVVVALIVAAFCMVFGTMSAIGITRTRFKLRGAAAGLHGATLVVPSLIIGVAAVMFFVQLRIELSLTTLTLMHIVVTFPLVTAIVAAGLVRFEKAPEEAAIDLGASQWQMVRYVMLPQIAPSLAAAGLYAFFESFNSFELSFFTGGYEQTFPVWVYALLKHGDNLPLINAAATFIAAVQVAIVIGGWYLLKWLLGRQSTGENVSDMLLGARG